MPGRTLQNGDCIKPGVKYWRDLCQCAALVAPASGSPPRGRRISEVDVAAAGRGAAS